MPLTSSAKIALRKDRRRTVVNKRVKTIMKQAVRTVRDTKDEKTLPQAYQAIDRASKKNLLHKKKASRLKSQLAKVVETDQPKTKKVSKTTTKKKVTSKKK